ncbi:hypothetical protein SAMN04488090_4858 [Siphonobacter aquaeclarae]|uniref:Tetratricopeptide repeat protein n=2 Tax=Siphonobacter aquaeclarae TaxID=563176 RepID=A0A1G9Y8M1_9BACT|nr:hypothetical protein SAMN04488090_4858 [Siphonobacter aquaeclarae]
MRKNLLFCCLMAATPLFAQRVDLDRFRVDVTYQQLPREPVSPDKRTYETEVKIGNRLTPSITESTVRDAIHLDGWKRVSDSPTVRASLNLEDVTEKEARLESRTESSKDKDGRSVSTTYYTMVVTYLVSGQLSISGPRSPEPVSARDQEEQRKKEEAVSTNRFLKNATISKPADAPSGPVVQRLSETLTVRTEESTDSRRVSKYFEDNRKAMLQTQVREFTNRSLTRINGLLNRTYGYVPVKESESLWILDAKNDEGAAQIEAIQAVKAIFSEMRADQSIENIKANLQPLIAYFESLKTKYTAPDKAGRKMRYSAFYNLAKIYLLTDQPEKAIQEAEGLIANDYDTGDGKSLKRAAEELLADFQRAQTRSRHQPTLL